MKTKEQKLKAITDNIQAKLPRLTELEKRCLFNVNGLNSEILSVFEDKSGKKQVIFITEGLFTDKWEFNELIERKHFKIIGKEPTILDCLEWLDFRFNVHTKVIGGHIEISLSNYYTVVSISLDKPLLKDNEELINFLYGLL